MSDKDSKEKLTPVQRLEKELEEARAKEAEAQQKAAAGAELKLARATIAHRKASERLQAEKSEAVEAGVTPERADLILGSPDLADQLIAAEEARPKRARATNSKDKDAVKADDSKDADKKG